jgi:hypothetical protein
MTRIAFLLVAVVTAAGGVAFIPAVSLLNYNRLIHVVGVAPASEALLTNLH